MSDLTGGTELRLFDVVEGAPPEAGLSRDARRTQNNKALLAHDVHPATRLPLLDEGWGFTCRDCHHAVRVRHRGPRVWWKCELHRLGLSRSADSDIRCGWPACVRFRVDPEDEL